MSGSTETRPGPRWISNDPALLICSSRQRPLTPISPDWPVLPSPESTVTSQTASDASPSSLPGGLSLVSQSVFSPELWGYRTCLGGQLGRPPYDNSGSVSRGEPYCFRIGYFWYSKTDSQGNHSFYISPRTGKGPTTTALAAETLGSDTGGVHGGSPQLFPLSPQPSP